MYWLAMDGYLSGVGTDLCSALKKLLDEFSLVQLRKIVSDIKDGKTRLRSGSDLYNLVKSQCEFKFNTSNDIEFEYDINFDTCNVSEERTQSCLGFGQIKAGQCFVPRDEGENESYLLSQLSEEEVESIMSQAD